MPPRLTRAYDYFSGGVPTGPYLTMRLNELGEILANAGSQYKTSVSGLAYIGLVAYSESFFKDHFASAVNIVPDLVKNLTAHSQNTKVDLAVLADSLPDLQDRLGFYLAENYDFGNAKEINARYRALLRLSPFSTKEAATYDRILHDRHLLVHHGGIYTTSYLRNVKGIPADSLRNAFSDGLTIDPPKFHEAASFMLGIAKKLINSSHQATKSYVEKHDITLSRERVKALDAFSWWWGE